MKKKTTSTPDPLPGLFILTALRMINENGYRKVTLFTEDNTAVTCTARRRPDRRSNTTEYVLTLGKPNFAMRRHIRLRRKQKLPPVTQVKEWPVKKKKK